ncbi:hypothetical protein V6N12_052583 [Hibiscus sabdariffa]|uniref:Uncharacterized protein n=1 Tax=Hibiscus sabdariffa TaxID=183260 RepID=A0ABR2C1Y0_9ROSI
MEIQLLPLTHCMNSLTSKLNKPLLFSSSSRLLPFSSSSSSTTRNTLKLSAAPLEAGWLKSLSCCPPTDDPTRTNADSTWVIGIDPDLSGAMALLKTDSSGCSAQGWWSGGFGYGLWIGVLVASGFSVIPVPSLSWKKEFELTGAGSTKDDSRRLASTLFPSLSDMLKRKKDHGRAEALLIAAYGKGLRTKVDPSLVENSV